LLHSGAASPTGKRHANILRLRNGGLGRFGNEIFARTPTVTHGRKAAWRKHKTASARAQAQRAQFVANLNS
jgi:hypothetical protein